MLTREDWTRIAAENDSLPPAAFQVINEASAELSRAIRKHGPMRGAHEGYAVILEELDELWDEIKRQKIDPVAMRKEALQVAAMALRFVVDVCDAKLEDVAVSDDPWDEAIRSFLNAFYGEEAQRNAVTINEIMRECLSISIWNQTAEGVRRVAKILRGTGWQRVRQRSQIGNVYVYYRPGHVPSDEERA